VNDLGARQEILSRIRSMLPAPEACSAEYAALQRAYSRRGTRSCEARLELFVDRLVDYQGEVLQVEDLGSLPEAIAQALRNANEFRVIVPMELPKAWLPSGFHFQADSPLITAEIDTAEAVVTTCELAVAFTGTIILVHGGAQGRRVLTLLPGHHICIVRSDQVVEILPEALAILDKTNPATMTTISGPSATSDIEMTRIRGVHGPRHLTVILIGGKSDAP